MKNANTNPDDFYKILLIVALPITLQSLLSTTLNLINSIVVGQLGQQNIAAVTLTNKFSTILQLMISSIGVGVGIFISQFWGKKDTVNINKIFTSGIIISEFFTIIFVLIGTFFSSQIMSLFSTDKSVIALSSNYFRLNIYSVLFVAISTVLSSSLISMGKAKLPVITSSISLIVACILNYCLVLGKFGFPKMGINGSAVATIISNALLSFLMITFSYKFKYIKFEFCGSFMKLSNPLFKNYINVTLPLFINNIMWSIAQNIYYLVYSRMDITNNSISAISITEPTLSISNSIFYGIANAAIVIVGNNIGKGDSDAAYKFAKRILKIQLIGSFAMSSLIAGFSLKIAGFYNVSYTAKLLAQQVLYTNILTYWATTFNMVNNIGILRTGGDTKFVMFLDIGSVWLISVPLALVSGLVLKLPLYTVYILIYLQDVVRFAIGSQRMLSKKWINNLTIKA